MSEVAGEEVRALLSRYRSGVSVVTVDARGQRLGLTIGSLVSLSLDPPLVDFGVAREAAKHELLREAGGRAISLLAAARNGWRNSSRAGPANRNVARIRTAEGATGAPLLVGALGWLECTLPEEVRAGTPTFFVCEVRRVELGEHAAQLVRVGGEFRSL